MKVQMTAFFLLVMAALVSPVAFAAEVFVAPTVAVGTPKNLAETVTELLRTSVRENGDEVVEEKDADEIFRTKLMKLGDAFILSGEKVKKGKTTFSTQAKAYSADDLDLVAKRIAVALRKDKPAEDTVTADTVTDAESSQGTNRKPARRGFSFGLGPALLHNLNESGAGLNVHTSLFWDINRAIFNLLFDFTWKGDAGASMLGIGGRYFFTETKVAPYVGGEFGLGATRIGSTALLSGAYRAGFAGALGAGVHIMRPSAINLDVGIRVMSVFRKTAVGIPLTSMLQVTLFWM